MKKVKCILSVLLALVMVFGLAACGNTPANNTPANNTPANNGSSAEPKYKEEITVVMESAVPTTDRFKAGTETTVAQRLWLVLFDRLIDKVDGKFVPMLATEWHTDDSKVFTFKLRDDVVFHNGEKFKADDVVYTYERAKTAVGANIYSLFARYIDKIEAVSDYELKITLNAVNRPQPQGMRG